MCSSDLAIRKPAVALFTLADYVATGIMSASRAEALRLAVASRATILVVGSTSTGKTTLTNALLAEVAKTEDRVVLIEDTRELQCAAPDAASVNDGRFDLPDARSRQSATGPKSAIRRHCSELLLRCNAVGSIFSIERTGT